MSKDNINESDWYIDLNKRPNHKKKNNYFYLFKNGGIAKKLKVNSVIYIVKILTQIKTYLKNYLIDF